MKGLCVACGCYMERPDICRECKLNRKEIQDVKDDQCIRKVDKNRT